jgi:hypothetical protein
MHNKTNITIYININININIGIDIEHPIISIHQESSVAPSACLPTLPTLPACLVD